MKIKTYLHQILRILDDFERSLLGIILHIHRLGQRCADSRIRKIETGHVSS